MLFRSTKEEGAIPLMPSFYHVVGALHGWGQCGRRRQSVPSDILI